jgi:hypothetical protein
VSDNRWNRFDSSERLIIEDALATYAGEYRNNSNLLRLAQQIEDELRETLNDERADNLGETEEDFA